MLQLINKLRKLLYNPLKGVSGYSLTELSITTSIIAVMAVGGLSILGKKNEADKVRVTISNMAEIETAIQGFIRTKGYIPCPALPALLETNVNFGKSEGMALGSGVTVAANYSGYNQTLGTFNTAYNPLNKCNNNGLANETGSVPVRTLGIADSLSYDGWGRKFVFRSASASGSAIDFGYPNFKGNIAIVDLKGTHKTTINDSPPFNDGAIYALISHGANGKSSGYARNVATPPSQATGIESKNTNHTRPLYIQDTRSKIFDDMVLFGTISKLSRQKIAESPIRIPDIACQNAQTLVRDGRSLSAFDNYAKTSTYLSNADTIFKSATILSSLCQNRSKYKETTGPTKISGLQLWMDANDSSVLFKNANCTTPNAPALANNDTISCWKDKSGQGNNATGGGGAIYSTGIVNSLPAIRFNGSSNNLYTQAFDLGQNTTFCAVVNPSNTGNNHFFDTPSGTPQLYIKSDAGLLYGSVWSGTTNYGLVSRTAAINNNHIMCYVYDNSVTALATMYVQGNASTATATGAYSNAGSRTRVIGSHPNPSNWYNGYISEIVAYSQAVSTSDRNKIEEYLSEKWGIPLAVSTATCPTGLVFQKTTDNPQGSCKCPLTAGTNLPQSFATDLVTANACLATPDNTYFGKCMAVSSAPDYNLIFASPSPTIAGSPDKSGMALWLDANDCKTIVLNPISASSISTTVKNWRDKSGQENHAVQTTQANQPLYVVNTLNSRPVLRFDGANDNLAITHNTNGSLNVGDTFSIFMTINKSSSTSDRYVFQKYSDYPAPILYSANGSISLDKPGTATVATIGGTLAVNTPYIISMIKSGSSLFMIKNGIDVTPQYTNQTFTNNVNNLHIGSNSGGSNNFFSGDMAEIILYNKALTSRERINIETYLSTKWDIIRYPDHATTATPMKTSLQLWLDASDSGTIYKDSGCFQNASAWDTVGCWADKSGLATPNNATQATTAGRPTYAPGSKNGLPIVSFNGTSNVLVSAANINYTVNPNISLFIVYQVRSGGGLNQALFGQDNGSWDRFINLAYSGGTIGISNGSGWTGVPAMGTVDTWKVLTIKLANGVASGSETFINGTSQGTFTESHGNSGDSVLYIGDIGSASGQKGKADIAELIVYNTLIGTTALPAQRLAIERYLGTKWGITVQ